MAKKVVKVPDYPSRYGSHLVMVDEEKTKLLGDESKVVCSDDKGDYVTASSRLDNGLSDQNRHSNRT